MKCRLHSLKIESNYSSRSLTPPLFTSSALLYFEKNAIHCPFFVSSTEVHFCAFFNDCQKQLYLVSKQLSFETKIRQKYFCILSKWCWIRDTSLKINENKNKYYFNYHSAEKYLHSLFQEPGLEFRYQS
jgi:hypothetical protein